MEMSPFTLLYDVRLALQGVERLRRRATRPRRNGEHDRSDAQHLRRPLRASTPGVRRLGCTGFETLHHQRRAGADRRPTSFPTDDFWRRPVRPRRRFRRPYGGTLKPGTPYALFCNDPGNFNFCGLSGDIQGLLNDLLDASSSLRLLQYLGNGNTLALPIGRARSPLLLQGVVDRLCQVSHRPPGERPRPEGRRRDRSGCA